MNGEIIMDEFEDRMKRDALAIDASVSPELRARIDASLRGTQQIRPVAESRTGGMNLWRASSITGLAAAVGVIALINWNSPVVDIVPEERVAFVTVPEYIEELQSRYPTRLENADFASPLEEELLKLRADIERAKANVEADIKFTF